jgi:hypothetical protein
VADEVQLVDAEMGPETVEVLDRSRERDPVGIAQLRASMIVPSLLAR